MHKRFILVVVILALLIATIACDKDTYANQRPSYYPNSSWVCEEYGMSLVVDENGRTVGSMLIEWEVTCFLCRYNAFDGRDIDFVTDDYRVEKSGDGQSVTYGYLFGGRTKLTKDRCEITIVHDSIGYFSELPAALVFVRQH